jgi:hypothetical protein
MPDLMAAVLAIEVLAALILLVAGASLFARGIGEYAGHIGLLEIIIVVLPLALVFVLAALARLSCRAGRFGLAWAIVFAPFLPIGYLVALLTEIV